METARIDTIYGESPPMESPPAPFLTPQHPLARDTSLTSPRARAAVAFRRALALKAQGRCGPAIVEFRRAAGLDPHLREAHFHAGECFMRARQYAAAAEAFALELERDRGNLIAARELGMALASAGHHDRAVPQLESITRLRVGDPVAWYELGFAYMGAERPDDAVRALRRSIQLDPGRAVARRDLGTVLLAQGKDDEGMRELRRALALDPKDAGVWVNLGNAHRRASRPDSALACYRQAAALDPDLALVHQAQASLLADRGRQAEAVEVYRTWLARRPEDVQARMAAVRLLADMGRRDQATELAREGVRRFPRSGDNRMLLGMTLHDEGRARAALDEFKRAYELFRAQPAGRERVRRLVLTLEANAPDSLRSLYAGSPWHEAGADSVGESGRRKAP
jgi:tetratricopeptide (TPR) repeat protein